MTRLLYLFIFFLFSFSAIAAENHWSYKYNEQGQYGKYSAGLDVGYDWYSVYPQKDGDRAVVQFGYWAPDLPPPDWFKVTLKSSDGSTLTLKDNITDSNMRISIFGDSFTITFTITKEHLEFHRKATSLKVALSNNTLVFPMTNSRAAINRAVEVVNNPTSLAAGLESLVDTCNDLATHPWDKSRGKAGIKWKDLQAGKAVNTCHEAYNMDSSNMRVAYQLGRAYDKAGDKRTLELLKYAADNGYGPAQYHYSLLMDDGVYIAKNPSEYSKYLIEAAKSGFTPAQSDYGEYLINQTPPNIEGGKYNLEVAVENNYNPARYFLAMKWFDGTFGARNNKLAFEYLTTASYLGHTKSSYYIATMYRDGNLVEKSPAKYLEYLKEAASQGHEKAKSILAQ